MTARIERPGEWRTLGNHEKRIGILEAVVSGAGSDVVCTGCYEIDPQYATCVELTPGACVDIDFHDPLTFNPSDPDTFTESANGVGPYLCNYQAGFRVQVRYIGPLKRVELWANIVLDPAVPGATGWEQLPTPIGNTTLTDVDTGWVTLTQVPSTGALGDPWSVYLGWINGSILSDGAIGPGSFCARYVSALDLANYTPQPQNAGDMLVAVGSPPEWQILPVGSPGQVLTINGSNMPEWT